MMVSLGLTVLLSFVATAAVLSLPDKNSVRVENGLAISDFKGYEAWQTISVSHKENHTAVILGNPAMIAAYKAGIPGNGRLVPDGARMAKIHWIAKINEVAPGGPTIAGALFDLDFMVKDANKYADGAGWGYARFTYNPASNTFSPATEKDSPPQGKDTKCGVACHTIVKDRDYVFTEYANR